MPLLNKRETSPNKAMAKKGEISMFATCNIILTNLRDFNPQSIHFTTLPSVASSSWQIGDSIESYEMRSNESVFGRCK